LRKGPSLEGAVQQIDQILGRLDGMNQEGDIQLAHSPDTTLVDNPDHLRAVFLGHGRSPLWSRVQLHLNNDLHLSVEIWESVSRVGHHNLEILKGFLKVCGFAVLVVTGEDAVEGGHLRARQNVIHEIGLFQGRIGFERVALLEQEGLEGFSNIDGLQRIEFQGTKIDQSFYELDRMLRREGFIK
jgi:predicted nucleotide-binding protein